MIAIAAALFGLIIGSFLTVCIYRIPYGRPKGAPEWDEETGEEIEQEVTEPDRPYLSINNPRRSICPACEKQLYWWHNIPLFSYVFLRGKCGHCGAPISIRYPAVETLSAILCTASYLSFGLTPTAGLVYAFGAALIVISFIDIDYYIIPDVISLPGIVLGLLIGVLNHFWAWFQFPVVETVWQSLGGLLIGGGVLLLISEVYYRIKHRVGLGFGDIKLLAMTGAFFGANAAIFTMFIGSVIGSIVGITMMLLSGKNLTYQIPFGPYLALGTLVYLFWAGSNAALRFGFIMF